RAAIDGTQPRSSRRLRLFDRAVRESPPHIRAVLTRDLFDPLGRLPDERVGFRLPGTALLLSGAELVLPIEQASFMLGARLLIFGHQRLAPIDALAQSD